MTSETSHKSDQNEGEINEESLMKLRQEVTDFIAEVEEFLTECGYTPEPDSIDKTEVDIINEITKLEEAEANLDKTSSVDESLHEESRREVDIESELSDTQEDEMQMRERIVQRMNTQNTTTNVPIETPLPVVSTNRKRKTEVLIDNEPSMECLVQPSKRKIVLHVRPTIGTGCETQVDHSSTVSVQNHACVPQEDQSHACAPQKDQSHACAPQKDQIRACVKKEDLRKVLQRRRRGLSC